jgi:hypothetical protein
MLESTPHFEVVSCHGLLPLAGAAAAVCISRPGAMPSLPTRQETLRELGSGSRGGGGGHQEPLAEGLQHGGYDFGGSGVDGQQGGSGLDSFGGFGKPEGQPKKSGFWD